MGLMRGPEKKFFIPTGDTAHSDLRGVALNEANELVEKIIAEGINFEGEIVRLSSFPLVNLLLLKEGITVTDGIMVNIREKDISSQQAAEALDEFVNLALENIEEAEARKEEILSKVPKKERKRLEDLMGFTCFLISEIEEGNYPPPENKE